MIPNARTTVAREVKIVEFTIPASNGTVLALSTQLTTSATSGTGLSAKGLGRVVGWEIDDYESDGNTQRAAFDWGTVLALTQSLPVAAGSTLSLPVMGAGLTGVFLRAQAAAANTGTVCVCYLR